MTEYNKLKETHAEELNSFKGLFFAFSNKQMTEALEKQGIELEQAKDKIFSIGGGGYILKDCNDAFKAMFARHTEEMKKLKADEKKLFEAIVYELSNHEYCITYDPTDALESLSLKSDELPSGLLKRATKQALKDAEAYN